MLPPEVPVPLCDLVEGHAHLFGDFDLDFEVPDRILVEEIHHPLRLMWFEPIPLALRPSLSMQLVQLPNSLEHVSAC